MSWLLHGFFLHRTPLGILDLSPQTGNTWKASCEPDPDLPRLCASEASKEAWVLRASLLKRPFSSPRRGCCPTLAASVLFCSWLYPWESGDEVAEGVTIPSKPAANGLCPERHQLCVTLPGIQTLVSLIAPRWAKFSEERGAPFQTHREVLRVGRE